MSGFSVPVDDETFFTVLASFGGHVGTERLAAFGDALKAAAMTAQVIHDRTNDNIGLVEVEKMVLERYGKITTHKIEMVTREIAVIKLAASGLNVAEIVSRTQKSERTVRRILKNT